MDVTGAVSAALLRHPSVATVRLIGSRADGTAHELSDWDFAVETADFREVERDVPSLLAPLGAVAEQWDRFSRHACYMLILRGPLKIDLLFLDVEREWAPAWDVSRATLAAVDTHFWDWILWLEQKRRAGRDDVLRESLGHMHELLLRPMGVGARPSSIADAVGSYEAARDELERRFGTRVPRRLEREVRPVVHGGTG